MANLRLVGKRVKREVCHIRFATSNLFRDRKYFYCLEALTQRSHTVREWRLAGVAVGGSVPRRKNKHKIAPQGPFWLRFFSTGISRFRPLLGEGPRRRILVTVARPDSERPDAASAATIRGRVPVTLARLESERPDSASVTTSRTEICVTMEFPESATASRCGRGDFESPLPRDCSTPGLINGQTLRSR